jgi:hypothetical protein
LSQILAGGCRVKDIVYGLILLSVQEQPIVYGLIFLAVQKQPTMTRNIAAFCLSAGSSSFCITQAQVCPRFPAAQSSQLSMTLAGELMFKAVEAGAVAFAARTLAPSTSNTKRPEKRAFFSSKKPETQASAADAVVEAFARALTSSGSNSSKEKKKESKRKPQRTDSKENGSVEVLASSAGTVVSGVAEAARADKWIRLACCVTIDLVGSGSLAVPLFGDALDLITAPLCALLIHQIFGSTLVTSASLAEEILPGTDAIPTATLAWLAQNAGYLAEYHPVDVPSPVGAKGAGVKENTARKDNTVPLNSPSRNRSFRLW